MSTPAQASAGPPATPAPATAEVPPPNAVKNAPTVLPDRFRPIVPSVVSQGMDSPDYGAHQSVPEAEDPAAMVKSLEEQLKGKDNDIKQKEKDLEGGSKALAHAVKSHYGTLSSRLKSATDASFLTGANAPWTWSSKNEHDWKVPQGNLFDAKKNPTLHGIYGMIRPMLMAPLLNRYAYGGLQPDLEEKSFMPIVMNQLSNGGPGKYNPGRDVTLKALGEKARQFGQMLVGQGSPKDLFNAP
jgi:hypothetical protein